MFRELETTALNYLSFLQYPANPYKHHSHCIIVNKGKGHGDGLMRMKSQFLIFTKIEW